MIKKFRLLAILSIIIPYINYACIIPQETSYLRLNPITHKIETKYYDDKIMDDFKQSLIEHRISEEGHNTNIKTEFRQKIDDLSFDMGFDTNGYPVVILEPEKGLVQQTDYTTKQSKLRNSSQVKNNNLSFLYGIVVGIIITLSLLAAIYFIIWQFKHTRN